MSGLDSRSSITGTFQASVQTRQPVAASPQPIVDPKNPFGSLTAGGNQFTILWDTDHSDPLKPQAITENMAAMAASGVRHVMIEYPPTQHSQDLLDKFYKTPPQASELDVMMNASLFETAHARTEADSHQSGMSYALMIIEARKHGIKVHLAGDEAGYALLEAQNNILQEQEAYLAKNAALNRIYEYNLKNPSLVENLAPANRDRLMNELMAHSEKLSEFTGRWLELDNQRLQERLGPETQIARADRFMELAQGEKAVVLWGQSHHGKLDVALDHRLRQEALKQGTLDRLEPTRSMDLLSSRSAVEDLKSQGVELGAQNRYFAAEKEYARFGQPPDLPESPESRMSPVPSMGKQTHAPSQSF